MTQQQIPYVVVISGRFQGREGRVLPGYNGQWKHVRFEDGRKPREAYVPPGAVR